MTQNSDKTTSEIATIGIQVDGEVENWEFVTDPATLSDQELADEMSQFEDLIEKSYSNKTPSPAMDQKSAMTYMRQHTRHTAELARRTLNESDSDDGPQILYVVVDPGVDYSVQSKKRPTFGDNTIVGVYDTREKAETAAENIGEYRHTSDMVEGEDFYRSALIYESQLNE